MKQRIILVSNDKGAASVFSSACERHKVLAECLNSPTEARARWFDENSQLLGVVGDSATLTPQDKYHLIAFHCEPGSPRLITLDPPQVPDPRAPLETVSRLRWPLPPPFLEALQDISDKPMVFLTDPTLFVTNMLQIKLFSAGLRPFPWENPHVGLIEQLRGGAGTHPGADEGGGLFGLGKAKKAASPGPSRTAILRWSGDAFDAQPLQQRVAQEIPEVRFFLVSSASASHAAERALRMARPAFLPRDLAEHAIDLLLGKQRADPRGLGRIIIVEHEKPNLIQLTRALMDNGHEVAACTSADEASKLIQNDRFHVAVLGTALAHAQHTAVDLAQEMHQLDNDIGLILMMDPGPIKEILAAVSKVASGAGVDDCIIKPSKESQDSAAQSLPEQLLRSVHRALERRAFKVQNRQLLEELTVSKEELEQLTGFQSKFFATVAHDVKNPLTAIRGYAELLSWKIKDAELLKCVSHIMSSSKTLEGLISDLVDYAAIESGKLRVNLEDLDLAAVAAEVHSRVQVAADKRKIKLHVAIPEGLPKLQGDPLRVGQVIQNLCTNAIQYTPEGGDVFIKVQPGPAMITVSVRDTGIGISKEDLPRIFERFFQAQNAQKMRRAGFGLGLKIAQEIVKAHGGNMGVDSEVGKGSVFYFTVPIPGKEADAAPPPSPPSIHGPHTPIPRKVTPPPPAGGPSTPPPRVGGPSTPPPQVRGPSTPPPTTPPTNPGS